jgi:hypothetical protein
MFSLMSSNGQHRTLSEEALKALKFYLMYVQTGKILYTGALLLTSQ